MVIDFGGDFLKCMPEGNAGTDVGRVPGTDPGSGTCGYMGG